MSDTNKNSINIGDKVEIINYGSLVWSFKNNKQETDMHIVREEGDIIWYDVNREIVGMNGIVKDIIEVQGVLKYSIDGIPTKTA